MRWAILIPWAFVLAWFLFLWSVPTLTIDDALIGMGLPALIALSVTVKFLIHIYREGRARDQRESEQTVANQNYPPDQAGRP